MKRLIMASAIAAVMASPAALADYELYGKAHIGLVSNDRDSADGSETSLESLASRVGIKGKTELTEGLDAIYKWEKQIDIDGEDSTLKNRNAFLGLKGGFGSLIGGIHDTPMKQSEGKIDLFSDVVDIARVQDKYMDTQERETDFLGYYSPKFNNMQVQVATMPGKADNADIGDAFSTALVYGDKKLKKTNFYGAIAYDSEVDGDDTNAIRLAGQMKLGAAKVGAIWEQADNGSNEKQDRYVLSTSYKLAAKNTLLLQYATSDDADGVLGSTDITVGLSHKLGKSTSVYGAINKGENIYDSDGNADDETNVVLGLVHKFKL